MIIAGEASGDLHGARLARALNQQAPKAFLFGIGGKAMRAAGVRLIVDNASLSVVGITEVIAKLPTIYRAMATVRHALGSLKPDLLIAIDFPDFNFRAAAAAKKLAIPVLYYISPQLWAWRPKRVTKIQRLVDHMAVILPFEAPFYRRHHVPTTFVGHPLLDGLPSLPEPDAPSEPDAPPTIGLLPGSRDREVSTLLPIMLQAAQQIHQRRPMVRFAVSCADSIDPELVHGIIGPYTSSLNIATIRGPVVQVFQQSRLLVAASGTVTLEAALYGIPTVIVYKVSPLSYWLGKRLITVKHIGLVNLIVQKELLPELIQHEASPENIAASVGGMLDDPEYFRRIKGELAEVRGLLGGPGASDRVAEIALELAGLLPVAASRTEGASHSRGQ